ARRRAERLGVPRPSPELPRPPAAARPARAAPLRGPQLDGALPRGPRAVPRPPPRRALLLARRWPPDRPRADEGGVARGPRRSAAGAGARAARQARLRDPGGE